jgi:transposase, IS5 family
MREVGRASSSGGKNKDKRLKSATSKYLHKANAFLSKLEKEIWNLPVLDEIDLVTILTIEHFMMLMRKHVDLVYRRIIKGETIPHQEKMFSVFETYTEMIKKGKLHPNVELGKKLCITTDQFHLIIDYLIMSEEQDRDIFSELKNRILSRFNVGSWSFDKGFWTKANKLLLKNEIEDVIMPKLGKRNKEEEDEERSRKFKELKNKHSAIESNINELEHRGLDRCPDKGFTNFSRYIGLAVSAYNLKKIGRYLLEIERQRNKLQVKAAA